jgi:hypothetical protein
MHLDASKYADAATARVIVRAARRSAVIALCAALAACSANSDNFSAAFVDPAKFTYYHCDHLNVRAHALKVREQELRTDMARAEQGAGGGLVNALAYRPSYLSVRGELDLLERTAAEKKCELKPAPPVATPASVTRPRR